MLHIKSIRWRARTNITAAIVPPPNYLPARTLSPLLQFFYLLLNFSKFLFFLSLLIFSDIPSALYFLHIPFLRSLREIKSPPFSAPPAYLAGRQIAPLVSKWPQQKDNDKRAVSQLSFPLSAPASHITVIDCSVSGSAIVPQDTQESCQEL